MTGNGFAESDSVIRVERLSRCFGRTQALDALSLSVPRGAVFGLVGANGAGKTTLIRHLLGLLRAHSGTVRVFGRDPVADPVGVLSRVGYLSEENDLPPWMRVGELLRYVRAFYPGWDESYAEELRTSFGLDTAARVRDLSRGQKARAGLLVALAYRPELLILDEPSTGLDPLARRDILAAVLRTVAQEGRTVLFSSHLLDEVERVSDHVALIDRGRVLAQGPLDEVRAGHRLLTVRFEGPRPAPPEVAGMFGWEGGGREWSAVCCLAPGEARAAVEVCGARVVEERSPTLDKIFVARVSRRHEAVAEGQPCTR
jgi:ABC-2 type transport system ATP-binding protein